MPTGYQIKEQDKLHFVTLQVVEWVDVFIRAERLSGKKSLKLSLSFSKKLINISFSIPRESGLPSEMIAMSQWNYKEIKYSVSFFNNSRFDFCSFASTTKA